MIVSVSANHPNFREIRFQPGLNVIVAEREETSTVKDSRNGLGKSSLISIIHWLLASNTPPATPDIGHDYVFFGEFIIRGCQINVERAAKSGSSIFVRGFPTDCPLLRQRTLTGEVELAAHEWAELLLWGWFDLDQGTAKKLTFRSLISYLIRRDPDGYLDFRRYYPQQAAWNQQACLAFLLGLNWSYPVELQEIKDREKQLKSAAKVLKSSVGAELLNAPSNMENQKVQLDITIERLELAVHDFRVHDEYQELEIEANQLTRVIAEIAEQQVINQAILTRYQESLESTLDDSNEDVLRMYSEAGVIMPELIARRLNDVVEFNRQLINNRRAYIDAEISRIESLLDDLQKNLRSQSERRASIMAILNTHGALNEYNKLHEELSESKRIKAKLEMGIETTRTLEVKNQELRVQKTALELRAATVLNDERDQVDRGIRVFSENTRHLYDQPGELHIQAGRFGLKFDVNINRAGSHGVENMKLFCFDLSVAQLRASSTASPNLLIHDSVIFDGVDGRQVAAAIELAASRADTHGFQYICFINSDAIPYSDFSEEFSMGKFLRLRLSDKDPSGSLFGHRF